MVAGGVCSVNERRWCLFSIINRYPVLSTRYSVMCKNYIGYYDTSEIEHGLCACTVDNPRAKSNPRALARGLSIVQAHKPCSVSHLFSDITVP